MGDTGDVGDRVAGDRRHSLLMVVHCLLGVSFIGTSLKVVGVGRGPVVTGGGGKVVALGVCLAL